MVPARHSIGYHFPLTFAVKDVSGLIEWCIVCGNILGHSRTRCTSLSTREVKRKEEDAFIKKEGIKKEGSKKGGELISMIIQLEGFFPPKNIA